MNAEMKEAIGRLCKLQEEVSNYLNDYQHAADCFCGEGGFHGDPWYDPERDYHNDMKSIEFIERIVGNYMGKTRSRNENADDHNQKEKS